MFSKIWKGSQKSEYCRRERREGHSNSYPVIWRWNHNERISEQNQRMSRRWQRGWSGCGYLAISPLILLWLFDQSELVFMIAMNRARVRPPLSHFVRSASAIRHLWQQLTRPIRLRHRCEQLTTFAKERPLRLITTRMAFAGESRFSGRNKRV